MKKLEDISTFLEFREYNGNPSKSIFGKMVGKNADDDLKNKSNELKIMVKYGSIRKKSFNPKFILLWHKAYDMDNHRIRDKLSFDGISAFQNNDDEE